MDFRFGFSDLENIRKTTFEVFPMRNGNLPNFWEISTEIVAYI